MHCRPSAVVPAPYFGPRVGMARQSSSLMGRHGFGRSEPRPRHCYRQGWREHERHVRIGFHHGAGCAEPSLACSPTTPAPAEPAPAPEAATPARPAPAPAPDVSQLPAGVYTTDPSHSTLVFHVGHLGFSDYTASFNTVKSELTLDPAAPETAKADRYDRSVLLDLAVTSQGLRG